MNDSHSDTLVFFGATGDLAYKKIFPALQAMVRRGTLNGPVIGVARAGWNLDQFKARAKDNVEKHGGLDPVAFDKLCGLLRYVDGDYNDAATFRALRQQMGAAKRPAYYLAIPPAAFGVVVEQLGNSGCTAGARVIIEKPFGRDLASAQALNHILLLAQPIAPDYGQQFLFPPALEDWVPADHPARFLREFVNQLDLGDLGFVMPDGSEGRPPFAPSLLLKIWLYGYFHRIRSTRKLEGACSEHLSLLWLTGLIAPDHNSLWRFWRDNKKALRTIFKQTAHLALNAGAVGFVLQALDGTKIQAACSDPKGWSKEYMEKLLAKLDAALNDIELKVIEKNPQTEAPGYRLPAGLAERQALREQIKKGLAQLQADGACHHRLQLLVA